MQVLEQNKLYEMNLRKACLAIFLMNLARLRFVKGTADWQQTMKSADKLALEETDEFNFELYNWYRDSLEIFL